MVARVVVGWGLNHSTRAPHLAHRKVGSSMRAEQRAQEDMEIIIVLVAPMQRLLQVTMDGESMSTLEMMRQQRLW